MKFLLPLILMLAGLSPDLALIQACLNGDDQGVTAALDQGASLEARHTQSDLTPLMLAIYRDHSSLVKLLLARGANADARNHLGFTPLMMAASGGQREFSEWLLDKGASLDSSDESGHTALMWAAFWGHAEVVALLLERGADPRLANEEGNTALMLAALGGTSQQSRQLLNRQRRHAPSGRVLPLLLNAKAEAELIDLLLARGARPETRNAQGQSALMLFAGQGKAEPVELLIARGAPRDIRDNQGLSAADYARRAGFTRLAKWLEE